MEAEEYLKTQFFTISRKVIRGSRKGLRVHDSLIHHKDKHVEVINIVWTSRKDKRV